MEIVLLSHYVVMLFCLSANACFFVKIKLPMKTLFRNSAGMLVIIAIVLLHNKKVFLTLLLLLLIIFSAS